MSISTAKGDDGTTGLFYGGRVRKDSERPEAYGQVDEAQAFIGVARAHVEPGSELAHLLASIERDLYVLMAELATDPANHHKLAAGTSLVTQGMVDQVGAELASIEEWLPMPTEFVIPGGSVVSAHLDVARTVVRRAERAVVALDGADLPVAYLNRLSDLLWALARAHEDSSLIANQSKDPS
jgi:cob(I)alamin adenosyltransferase